ncbi:hypothetical protein BKA70DRAFT_1444301 [Coprinopsis sp. MPI-PUGE-AT-0042]|nr:hypothetical protein BKA70DRAFT_1444301 [Coprinopsis sp. MPI-PUGE-AT-0042]
MYTSFPFPSFSALMKAARSRFTVLVQGQQYNHTVHPGLGNAEEPLPYAIHAPPSLSFSQHKHQPHPTLPHTHNHARFTASLCPCAHQTHSSVPSAPSPTSTPRMLSSLPPSLSSSYDRWFHNHLTLMPPYAIHLMDGCQSLNAAPTGIFTADRTTTGPVLSNGTYADGTSTSRTGHLRTPLALLRPLDQAVITSLQQWSPFQSSQTHPHCMQRIDSSTASRAAIHPPINSESSSRPSRPSSPGAPTTSPTFGQMKSGERMAYAIRPSALSFWALVKKADLSLGPST